VSSQDKAGPGDGTEDAATEGQTKDGSHALPDTPQETPQDADAMPGDPVEDAEILGADGEPDRAADDTTGHDAPGATDDTTIGAGGDQTDADAPDGVANDRDTDPDHGAAGAWDAGAATDATAPPEPGSATTEDAADGGTTDRNDESAAAAALAGTAAGAALGGASGGGAHDATAQPAAPAPAATAPAPETRKSGGGFFPALLGGVIAAGLGFGGALYLGGGSLDSLMGDDDAVSAALAAQERQLSALDARLEEMATALAAPDDAGADDIAALGDRLAERLGGVADRIDTLAGTVDTVQGGVTALDERIGTLDGRLVDVTERLGAVERRPLTESSEAAQAAFSAYEDDIAELRAALEEQTRANEALAAQMEERLAAAQAEVEAAAERAAELQAQAEEQARIAAEQAEERARIATERAEARARDAAVREALAGLDAALERGAPFAGYLSVLGDGAEVPQPLAAAAESGVASMPELRAAFTPLARDALDASIRETVDDGITDRAVAFLRAQTGFRSLAPREGDDPDAVLSRAEAALRAGDLATATSELTKLPPAGQAVMADWMSRAEQRRNVTEAAETLAATLLAN